MAGNQLCKPVPARHQWGYVASSVSELPQILSSGLHR